MQEIKTNLNSLIKCVQQAVYRMLGHMKAILIVVYWLFVTETFDPTTEPRMPFPIGSDEFPVSVMALDLTFTWQMEYQNQLSFLCIFFNILPLSKNNIVTCINRLHKMKITKLYNS